MNTFVFLILISFHSWSFSYIQVKASTDRDSIESAAEQFSRKHIPYMISEFQKNGIKYYRLRLGAFVKKNDAQKVAAILKLDDFWIVKDVGTEPEKTVEQVVSDTLFFSMIGPGFLMSESKDVVCIYNSKVGFESARAPGDLYIYASRERIRHKIENVTGFRLKQKTIDVNVSKVVIADPGVEDVTASTPGVKEFARINGLSVQDVLDHFSIMMLTFQSG